jgi:hypothetical protein
VEACELSAVQTDMRGARFLREFDDERSDEELAFRGSKRRQQE